MTKRSITIIWAIGSVVMFAGFFGSVFVAVATNPGGFMQGQSNNPAAWLFLSLFVAGIGILIQLVAWLGAVFNSHLLADKTWFNVLLWVGIVGIVLSPVVIGGLAWWGLMLAYVVGAPDGNLNQPATSSTRLAPTH